MKHTERLRNNLKFKPLHLLLYALILGLAGYIIIISRAAPPPPTVYLTPDTRTLPANTTFTVALRENSGTTPVNAVQGTFTYPETLLNFVSIDYTGSAFGLAAQNTGGAGQVSIARAVDIGNGVTQVTGDQLVGTVTFQTKATTGVAALTFIQDTLLTSATTSKDILGSLSVTGGANITVDNTAPAVTVTTPANGATIAGGTTVPITSTATDNTGTVSNVTVSIDGALKATLTTSPYTYSWNTSGVALGAHTIDVRATDPYGNVSASSPRTVTLTDQTAPSVSLTAPTAGAIVKGTYSVTATATDNSGGTGISKVEFYVDNVLKFSDAATPYAYSWDSKSVTDGSHTISAKAYDGATPANTSPNSTVTFTVENTDQQAPSTPTSLRTTATGLTSISLAWNASTDNVGVTGYRVQRNGTTIATVTSLTYNDTALTAGTSYNYSVVAIDASNNTSSAATLTTSTVSIKPGDVDQDNVIGLKDLAALLQNWGLNYGPADFDNSGKVGLLDLSTLLTNYGK